MGVGAMKDEKLKLTDLRASHTTGLRILFQFITTDKAKASRGGGKVSVL